jgi:hypothetical protein
MKNHVHEVITRKTPFQNLSFDLSFIGLRIISTQLYKNPADHINRFAAAQLYPDFESVPRIYQK